MLAFYEEHLNDPGRWRTLVNDKLVAAMLLFHVKVPMPAIQAVFNQTDGRCRILPY
tara:strand:+ start:685 stop:852 length:168 start_codon:yes stop_codon:yes gene_type:complete